MTITRVRAGDNDDHEAKNNCKVQSRLAASYCSVLSLLICYVDRKCEYMHVTDVTLSIIILT